MAIDQVFSVVVGEQRHVPGQQHDRSGRPIEGRSGRQQGVAGAKLWLLDHKGEAGLA